MRFSDGRIGGGGSCQWTGIKPNMQNLILMTWMVYLIAYNVPTVGLKRPFLVTQHRDSYWTRYVFNNSG
jgi:hypothetical protein